MLGSLIGWVVLGLVAGFLARLAHPGRDPMGVGATVTLGVCRSLLGGGIAYLLQLGTSPYEPGGWILATTGAVLLLALGWFGTRGRVAPWQAPALTCRDAGPDPYRNPRGKSCRLSTRSVRVLKGW